jgi:hypothetical protein
MWSPLYTSNQINNKENKELPSLICLCVLCAPYFVCVLCKNRFLNKQDVGEIREKRGRLAVEDAGSTNSFETTPELKQPQGGLDLS